jgi:hypothetical protein
MAAMAVVRHSGIALSSDRYQSGIGPVDGFKACADSGTVGIAVLGPLEVDGQGHGLGPRDRVVLSALVVRAGDPISTEALADALWGDQLPASWAKVVQGCVVRLRKRLGAAAIESGAAGYRLTLNEAEVDNRRFERLFERARQAFAGGGPGAGVLPGAGGAGAVARACPGRPGRVGTGSRRGGAAGGTADGRRGAAC